jgi:hypothetical protein
MQLLVGCHGYEAPEWWVIIELEAVNSATLLLMILVISRALWESHAICRLYSMILNSDRHRVNVEPLTKRRAL